MFHRGELKSNRHRGFYLPFNAAKGMRWIVLAIFVVFAALDKRKGTVHPETSHY